MNDSTNGSGSPPAGEIRLSVCIPVYNFAAFLGATLDSILPQVVSGVEVLVLDGGSVDRTPELMRERTSCEPCLRYVRFEKRGGIDADIAKCVELAHGDYCWLFSGDDIMRPGALASVLDWIRSEEDVYLGRHTICDRDMRYLFDYAIFTDARGRTVDLADPRSRIAYLANALNTEAIFSFMSGQVIRRETWKAVPEPAQFMRSCWGLAARLLSASETRLRVCCVNEIWLDKRGGNDSFMDRGLVNRLRIAIEGFTSIATAYFGADSSEAAEIRRMLRNEVTFKAVIYTRSLTDDNPGLESRAVLDRLVAAIYSDPGLRNLLVRVLYRHTPASLLRIARAVYRFLLQAGLRIRTPPAATGADARKS